MRQTETALAELMARDLTGEDITVLILDGEHLAERSAGAPAAGLTGARSNYTKPRAEPEDHALGRSRGGWTTKIHALVDDSCAAVLVRLTAGQANDNPQLAPLVSAYTAYRHRNTVERGFNRLKHWRGVATRYDKYALTYLGGVWR